MEYITVIEAAEKWGLSRRSLSHHLTAGRIPGAVKKGGFWLIPKDAAKPEDKRRKKDPAQTESKTPFQPLTENKDVFVEIIKHFPHPVQICDPEGAVLFANDAFFRFARVADPPEDLRKYNVLTDPNLERWGIKDYVQRAYQGEIVHAYDLKVPLFELAAKFDGDTQPRLESLFKNVTSFPIFDEHHQVAYVVTVFSTSRYYQGRDEVIKGKEYLDDHWKEEFDVDTLSAVVHMSKQHYTRLFKEHTGMTPHLYHQSVKLHKLKEMLCDTNLSISRVFDECGVNYNGKLAKKLKQELGMTPSEYRTKMIQE